MTHHPESLSSKPPAIDRQLTAGLSRLAFFFVPLGLALTLLYWVSMETEGLSFYMMTQDLNQALGLPAHVGLLSNLGILVWWSTSIVCLFSAALARSLGMSADSTGFLTLCGILITVLALDDFFQIHERFENTYAIGAIVLNGFYAISITTIILRYWRFVMQTEWITLIFALGCLAASMLIDVMHNLPTEFEVPHGVALEDIFKIIGICGLALYLIHLSWRETRRLFSSRSEGRRVS